MVRHGAADEFDAIVIGSGFGGCMAALDSVESGRRVLMLERGGWVRRGPDNWTDDGAFFRTPFYAPDSAFSTVENGKQDSKSLCTCVGGPSVFYGGASFRFRQADFAIHPEIVAASGAAWPFDYSSLEPYYARAEQLLGVSGEAGIDPTEPPRSAPFPQAPGPLSVASSKIADAARSLGLQPFRIPLAINNQAHAGPVCARCTTCDAFACAVSAKNDLAVRMVPRLVAGGMELRPNAVVTRLLAADGRITCVEYVDKATGEKRTASGANVVLAAGALATAHLLLASGLERLNPAGHAVGRYLMRHCNAMTYGVFPFRPDPVGEHHKQIALHDYYFGASEPGAPAGKLGNIQQVMGPKASLITHVLPRWLGWTSKLAEIPVSRLTGLLSIAEDQPRPENRARIDTSRSDAFGLPRLVVEHLYTERDLAARAFLIRKAKQVLRRAGALFFVTWNVSTFSHAVGTVRMGTDERTSPLDPESRFRGLENLYITDGSALPTSAGVNPSLTIAANALRVGQLIGRGVPALTSAQAVMLDAQADGPR